MHVKSALDDCKGCAEHGSCSTREALRRMSAPLVRRPRNQVDAMRRHGISGHVWNGQMRLKSVAPRTHASSEEVTVSVILRERSSSGADDRGSLTLENAAGPANVKLSLARHSADRQARTRATRFVITAVNRYGSRPGPTSCLVRDHVRVTSRRWDEDARGVLKAGGNGSNGICAEPASRPKPAARRVEAKCRALTPASTGRHSVAARVLLRANHMGGNQ
jgi:hypothetical protein